MSILNVDKTDGQSTLNVVPVQIKVKPSEQNSNIRKKWPLSTIHQIKIRQKLYGMFVHLFLPPKLKLKI